MTHKDLQAFKDAELDGCDPASLTDIRTIPVDRTQPAAQRMADFLHAVGNPYLFRVGDVVVKVSFDSSGKRLTDALSDALSSC